MHTPNPEPLSRVAGCTEQEINQPTPKIALVLFSAMMQDDRAVATCFFERICQNKQSVPVARDCDVLRQAQHGRSHCPPSQRRGSWGRPAAAVRETFLYSQQVVHSPDSPT